MIENPILVTGADGFIGSRVCQRIVGNGDNLRRVVRKPEGRPDAVIADIGPLTDWTDALLDVDCVIHLAARAQARNRKLADSLDDFRKVNVEGTLKLAQDAADAGVRRFVYLSSIKVNGEETCHSQATSPECAGRPFAFTEKDTPSPQNAYAVSKTEAEKELSRLERKTRMEVVIIRPPLVYGPAVKGNLASLMCWLQKGIPLPLGAIKNNRRSLIGLDNLVDFILTCIDHPAAANNTFLAADGEDLSTEELLRRLAATMNKTPRLIPVPRRWIEEALVILGRREMARRLCGSLQIDITKARKELGWTAPVGVDEGLRRMTAPLASRRSA